MSVFGRLNFCGAGPSTAHIGGGRNNVMALESVSYHRDEIRSAVGALPGQIGAASPAELMVTCQPHKGRARRFAKRGQGTFGGIGFRSFEGGVVHLTG